MITFFSVCLLISVVLVISEIEKRMLAVRITPFFILALPATILITLAFFFAPALGMVPLRMEVPLIWAIGLVLFFLGGVPVIAGFGNVFQTEISVPRAPLDERQSLKWILPLSWIVIFIIIKTYLGAIAAYGGIQGIGTDEFIREYFRGWKAHVLLLSYGFQILLIGIVRKKNVFILFTIVVMFLLNVLYSVKSWILLPLVAGLIYRHMCGRLKISMFMGSFVASFVVLFYLLSYMIGFVSRNIAGVTSTSAYMFLFNNFFHYAFAGILGMGEKIHTGIFSGPSPEWVFAPFLNLYSFFTGGQFIPSPSTDWVKINNLLDLSSNVNSFFGCLWLYLERVDSLFWVLLFGIFSYILFTVATISKNCWIMVGWCFFAAGLFFGFFDYHFVNLALIEIPVHCIILALFFRLIRTERVVTSTRPV